jgi:hypothetical protein
MLRRVALVRTDVSEELNASFITVTRIGELGTTLAVTSNRRTLVRDSIKKQRFRSWIIRPQARGGQICRSHAYLAGFNPTEMPPLGFMNVKCSLFSSNDPNWHRAVGTDKMHLTYNCMLLGRYFPSSCVTLRRSKRRVCDHSQGSQAN